ncbi:unnamed protein product [Cylindrotheca closterium]|uniref:SHSP domain-containing protein n=1 Tax=Cylindrotheca closterium TaxID=2856 RepID=A0AAD2G9R6_9STRA|nr:unnamed protein product [Cylindrotheca closterium]
MPSAEGDHPKEGESSKSEGSSFFGRLFDHDPQKLEEEIHDQLNAEEIQPRRTIDDEMDNLFQAFAGFGSQRQDPMTEHDSFPFPAAAFQNAFHGGFQRASYRMHQDNQNVYVEFDVPGTKKEEMNLEVVDIPSCVIEFGQSANRRPTMEGDARFRQFSSSSFSQRLRLGPSVDCEKMSANLSRGVLRLSAPIKEEKDRKPVRLSIPIDEQS